MSSVVSFVSDCSRIRQISPPETEDEDVGGDSGNNKKEQVDVELALRSTVSAEDKDVGSDSGNKKRKRLTLLFIYLLATRRRNLTCSTQQHGLC